MSIHNKKEGWVVANPDGMIITAWCFYMTRASRCCNHVSAFLYKVEYANTNNVCSPACTSIPYVRTNQQKNHRTKNDNWNCYTKKRWDQVWEINRKIQYLVRNKECKSVIYLIHKPIFTGNVKQYSQSTYQNSFILCHYQALLPSYLNLLRVCQLQPPWIWVWQISLCFKGISCKERCKTHRRCKGRCKTHQI